MENHIDIPNSATTDSAIINNNNNNNYNNNNNNNSNNNNDNNNYFYDEKLTPTSADDPESMTSGIDSTNSFANIEKSKCTPLDGIIGKKKKFYHLIKINLWLLPLLGAIMIPISCISLYYGAIKHEIVYPLFPYVSDTGSMTPMAPYFSLFLDLSGIIIIIVGWARYKTIKFYLNHIQPNDSTKKNMQTFEFYMKRLYKCNLTLLILCFLGAFGSMVIGNFRTTENMTGHLIGAFFLFFSLLIFMLISCYVTWKLYSYAGIESKPISMILILLVYSISLFIVCLCAFISIIHHGSIFKYWDNEFRLNWSPKDDGYHWHCTATINEWIAINSMALFFLTISRRLRKFEHWDKVFF